MDYTVRFIALPRAVRGITVKDSDDFFNIYINVALSERERSEALAHELGHAYRDDFSTGAHISLVEAM